MLARALWLGYCVELGIYGVGGILLWRHAGFALAQIALFALVILLTVRTFFVALTFAVAWWFRSQAPAELRIGTMGVLKLFGEELGATLLLYLVLFPLERWFEQGPLRQSADRHGSPVLLIHGFFCNRAYWWPMKRFLRSRGFDDLFTLDLEPLLGSIEGFARQVAARVEQIQRSTGARQIILVAHSMGGLAARCYVQRYGGADAVAKLITLGSPHHGTEHARLVGGEDVRQMRPGSRWLGKLNEGESQPAPVPITSIYSCQDNIIAPQTSPVLSHAKNIPLAGVGHLAMTFSKQVQRLVYHESKFLGVDANLNPLPSPEGG